MDELLTTKEVAALLRCCPKTIYRKVNARDLPVVLTDGNAYRFRKQDIAAYIAARTVVPSRIQGVFVTAKAA